MSQDTRPFWQKPLPPIRYPNDDPLAEGVSTTDREDRDPLEDAAASVNGRPPVDTDPLSEVTLADAPVSLPGAVAKAAEPEVTLPASPPLSVVAAQAQLVETQMRVARATEAQGMCRGKVALALEKFQRATMQTCTPEQLRRQFIESENEQRRLRAEGKLPPRGGSRRLGSAVDAYAFYTRASGKGAGGGAAFRRGAMPASRRTPK